MEKEKKKEKENESDTILMTSLSTFYSHSLRNNDSFQKAKLSPRVVKFLTQSTHSL